MINPSLLLRRAIQIDAVVSGAMALLLTFAAGMLAPLLQSARSAAAGIRTVPDRLCGTGRLARHPRDHAEAAGAGDHRRQRAVDARQHRTAVLGRVTPNLLGQIFVAAQAIAVGVFAELQYIGLRRSAAAQAA